MLDISPETRIKTQEILAHPWIQKANISTTTTTIDPIITTNTTTDRDTGNGETGNDLHGKSSVLHGHLLKTSVLAGGIIVEEGDGDKNMDNNTTNTTTINTIKTNSNSSNASDINLSRALDHLADHIKELKTEKLVKTVTKLMLAKHKSHSSKLAALYLHHNIYNTTIYTNNSNSTSSSGSIPIRPPSMSLKSSASLTMAPIKEDDFNHSTNIDDINATTTTGTTSSIKAFPLSISTTSPLTTNSTPTTPTKQVITPTGDKYDELMQMINSESKEIVTTAMFRYFGADSSGNLSIVNFIRMIKRIGIIGMYPNTTSSGSSTSSDSSSTADNSATSTSSNSTTTNSTNSNSNTSTSSNTTTSSGCVELFGLFAARFADRGNKGYVTPEDFYTIQVGRDCACYYSIHYIHIIYKC